MDSQLEGVLGAVVEGAGNVGLESELDGVRAANRENARFLGGVGVVPRLGCVLGMAVERAGLPTGLGGVMGYRGTSNVL